MSGSDPFGAQAQNRNGASGIASRPRSGRDEGEGSHVREIELKRSRGEVSCAECRRLKIKCDRQLPCSSCLRRGCASLCPNGSLATGQGTRFVLAATDHLHRRIAKMSERIRQLEDALAIMQSHQTTDPHPLLRDELLNLKAEKIEPLEESAEMPNTIEGMATLSITDKGVRFFGYSGGPELMLADQDEEPHSSPSTTSDSPAPPTTSMSPQGSKSPQFPPELALFSNSFPFTPIGAAPEVKARIESHLPSWNAAIKLADIYQTQAGWLFRSVSRSQLMDELLPTVYKRAPPSLVHTHSGDYEGPHALAIVLMTFAIGTLVDLSQKPYSPEGDHYFNLAKAAFALQNVFENPELFSIQAVHLMSIYIGLRESRSDESDTGMEMSWSLIRLCHQLAVTIGLHRDSARWGLSAPEVERRRELFWDIFVADSWQTLATGRPPSITTAYSDCQFPRDEDARLNEEGKVEPGFSSWMFHFVSECVSEVAAKTLTAVIPPYSIILALDAKIRDFPLPAFPDSMPLDPSQPALIMARYAMSHCRETILLYLHRGFFAQAMTDDPVNPLRSQFAPSFLATYRSATHILKTIREEFDLIPALAVRYWMPWTYAFSSAIVVGSVVTRGPSSTYAPASLQELNNACELFARAGQHSRRAAKASAMLEKLRAKANAAYEACLQADGSRALQPEIKLNVKHEKDDELDLIGGRVRLVNKKALSSNGSSPDVHPTSSGVKDSAIGETQSYQRPTINTMMAGGQNIPPERSPLSTTSSSITSPIHLQNLSALRSANPGPDPNPATPSAGYPHYEAVSYRLPGDHNAAHGAYAAAAQQYPRTVDLDEWAPGNGPRHAASAYSHSSRPEVGMDGMEYGHPGNTTIAARHPAQYAPGQEMHLQRPPGFQMNDPYGGAYTPPPAVSTPHASAFFQQGEHAPEYYPPAPRDLSDIGLVSQHSGLNQRWTHFMQDSGVFYSQQGQSL